MARRMRPHATAQTPVSAPSGDPGPETRPDWRGWTGLAWVVFWGCAYALMVIQARSPQVLQWFRSVAGITRVRG
jgi:hypothetical protein